MKTQAMTLTLASMIALAGCNSGGNSSPSNHSPPGGDPSTTSVSGKAADGYLVGASVCLDLNGNKKCDAGEPSATTGAAGAFTVDVPANVDADAHAIVVEVGASTIDEDTGAPVAKPFVLSAPAGKPNFVSPLTTAVHAVLEANPSLSADEAAAHVRQLIGATSDISLFEDYVAAKDSGSTDAAQYARLHGVAQISARTLANNLEAITAAASEQGLDPAGTFNGLLALVVQQVLETLDQAANHIDNGGSADGAPVTTVNWAEVDLQQEVEAATAPKERAAVEAMLAQGAAWLFSEHQEDGPAYLYEYGIVQAGSTAGTLQEQWFLHNGTAWVAESDDDEAQLFLGPEGWVQAADTADNFTVTYQPDGSARLALPGVDFTLKATAAVQDVAGKPIKTLLQRPHHQPFADKISGDPLFDPGAKAYQVNFVIDVDAYEISNWTDCGNRADDRGFCNVIYGYASNTSSVPAKSFSEVLYPTAPEPNSGNYFGVGPGIHVRAIEGGTLQIEDWENNGAVSSGSWSYRTVHGQQLMMLTLPDKFSARLYDEGQQPFLAVQDGYVRRGSFLAKGSIEPDGLDLWFNQTALQNIKDRLQFGQPPGSPASALVGSWHLDAEDVVITFLPGGQYLMVHGGVADDSGTPGLEFGSYAWDSATGALEVTTSVDQNGRWGMSHPMGTFTASIEGSTLTITESGRPNDVAVLSRVAAGTGSIVGSWMQAVANESLIVITFLGNGKYFHGEIDAADETGRPGQEIGTYAWDAETRVLDNTSIVHDSNGEWGMSHPQGEMYAEVVNGQLQVGEQGDTTTLQEVGAP